jgi:hypothetical protein
MTINRNKEWERRYNALKRRLERQIRALIARGKAEELQLLAALAFN